MAENKKGKITLEDLGYGSGLQSKKRFINNLEIIAMLAVGFGAFWVVLTVTLIITKK